MVLYELNVLLSTRAPTTATVNLVRTLARGAVRSGGVVHKVSNHGIRPLGYTIRKAQKGHQEAQFVAMDLDIGPKVLHELEHSLRVSPHVLRYMSLNNHSSVAQINREMSDKARKAAEVNKMRQEVLNTN
eukprot:TRINITY_DN3519_c0_g1_i3.p2 TRINITY_DN3519_c0_g1~~TRINITY_DN3519_c0_g1_i3.p2  ORF type:complete len:130 (-),score=30.99 TRINITY_DN3519_c0_g1_i3:209-598(-)